MKRLTILIGMILIASASFGALKTTDEHPFIKSEDTSTANAQLSLTTVATGRSSLLRSINIVCSASTTITATVTVDRVLVSGTETVLLPSIPLTTTTSGALYATIPIFRDDVMTVVVPAAGGGITCSVVVVMERR